MSPDEIPPALAARLQDGKSMAWTLNGVTRFVHRRGEVLSVTDSPDVPETQFGNMPKSDPMATLGPQLWRELHEGALTMERFDGLDDPSEQQAWKDLCAMLLAAVEERLPATCTCKDHWRDWKEAHPPDFGPGFFAWTVAAHNAVRARQGKPLLSLEEARALY